MNFGYAPARKGGDANSNYLFQQLLGLPDKARAKLAAMRERRQVKSATGKALTAARPAQGRVEPTVTPPKPPPAADEQPRSFAHLAKLAGDNWSAMWRDKEAAGPSPAIREERARMLSILSAPEAANNPPLAAHLAFQTDHNAATAIGVLRAFVRAQPEPEPRRASLSERMASVRIPPLGTEPPQPAAGTPEAAAALILNSMKNGRHPARP